MPTNPHHGSQADKPTSAPPKVVMGVTFRCYPTGFLRYEWRSDDGRLCAYPRSSRETYIAVVDGVSVVNSQSRKAKRFRTLENAMRAAVVRGMPA